MPEPSKPGAHIPTRTRLGPEVPINLPESRLARNEEGPRQSYPEKRFFDKHGYTDGCEGCMRQSAGMSKNIVHEKRCRDRMVELLATTEDGRAWLENANSKIEEYMETRPNEAKEAETKTRLEAGGDWSQRRRQWCAG